MSVFLQTYLPWGSYSRTAAVGPACIQCRLSSPLVSCVLGTTCRARISLVFCSSEREQWPTPRRSPRLQLSPNPLWNTKSSPPQSTKGQITYLGYSHQVYPNHTPATTRDSIRSLKIHIRQSHRRPEPTARCRKRRNQRQAAQRRWLVHGAPKHPRHDVRYYLEFIKS